MTTDLLSVQETLFYGLLSCSLFDHVNVVLERELLSQSQVDFSTIWQTPRNGRSGAGLLVEMPRIEVPAPNSLQEQLIASVVALEERNLNALASTVVEGVTVQGTGNSAEQWAKLVKRFGYGWLMGGTSGLTPERRTIERAKDFVDVIAYRISFSFRSEEFPLTRVEQPAVAQSGAGGLTITLSCATAGAAIYYSTDGNFPGPGDAGHANASAHLYAAPFAISSGATLKVCAFKSGLLPSHVKGQVIS